MSMLRLGFIPLVDAAPLIVAHEMGFAAEEDLELDLARATSWAEIRDMLSFGHVQAAHMLAPIPVATALGLGGAGVALSAVSVLSANGTVIGVSRALAEKMRAAGHDFAFNDAAKAGRALIAASPARLRIGVPFPFSMHAELVFYWLTALGLTAPQGVDVRTVPPSHMARALKEGEIDAFCVGEPWGSIAVETEVGDLLLPGQAIWAFAPEKVLATRAEWAEAEPALRDRLIRALWRAGRWLAEPGSQSLAAEILSRRPYLDLSAEIIERGLTGRLVISPSGEMRRVPQFLEFHRGAASFPWHSQAEWIGRQMAGRLGLDVETAAKTAGEVFRSDLYRTALRHTNADLPGASAKVEGALGAPMAVSSPAGRLTLLRDSFFDGQIFDPIQR